MEYYDEDIVTTDDLGRPVYGPRTLTGASPRRPYAWNCGPAPLAGGETKPGLRRRNPGLAFADAAPPPRA